MNQRTPRRIAVNVAGILWVAVIGAAALRYRMEVYLTVLSAAILATLVAIVYLADYLATLRADRDRMSSQDFRAALADHADRMESAIKSSADAITDQVLSVEHFFGVATRSTALARIQADEMNAAIKRDTGPFRVYDDAPN